MIEIAPLDPRSEAARALIAELDAYLAGLYPPESNYLDPPEALAEAQARFLGVFREGRLIGCGAVKLVDGAYAEIKRLYVRESARGLGAGGRLLLALESFAGASGYGVIRLETGVRQTAALALFARHGYRRVGPFGDYAPGDPLSVFMEKRLHEGETG